MLFRSAVAAVGRGDRPMCGVCHPAPWFRADLSHAQMRPIYPLERQESIHGFLTFDEEAHVKVVANAIGRMPLERLQLRIWSFGVIQGVWPLLPVVRVSAGGAVDFVLA